MEAPTDPAEQDPRDHVSALFVRYSPEVRGFILALLPNPTQADDVFQETFITVVRKSADFRRGTNFLAWACTIARYKVLEAVRARAGGMRPLSEEVMESLCASMPEPQNEDRELQALNDCVEELHPHTKRAVELRYEQGHKPAEIANRLGWTAESVYVVLSRARSMLRDCISRKLALNEGLRS